MFKCWINHYPLDNSIGFASVCPLDSDLSGGQRHPSFEQLGPGVEIGVFAFYRKQLGGQEEFREAPKQVLSAGDRLWPG